MARKKKLDGTTDNASSSIKTKKKSGASSSSETEVEKENKELKAEKHRQKILANQEKHLEKHKARLKAQGKTESVEKNDALAKNQERFFVTNKSLLAELIAWRDSAEKIEERIISENLGKMILTIATKLTNHSNFIRYPNDIKNEMISYACFKVIQGLPNYNFAFKNPFAYITQACYNAFLSVCGKYYRQLNIKREIFRKMVDQIEGLNPESAKKLYDTYLRDYIEPETTEANKETEED